MGLGFRILAEPPSKIGRPMLSLGGAELEQSAAHGNAGHHLLQGIK